jgi:hypothetical protein
VRINPKKEKPKRGYAFTLLTKVYCGLLMSLKNLEVGLFCD